MSDTVDKKHFNSNQKLRIAKIIFKDKDGNIIGECDNEHNRHKTG